MHDYFEIGDQTIVQLIGADRAKLLNNLCTQDLKKLAPGRGAETFLTDVKGRILAHVLVVSNDREIELITVAGQADRIVQHIDRYTIREDVAAKDLSSESKWLAVRSASEWATAFDIDSANFPIEPHAHGQVNLDLSDGTSLVLQCYRWPCVGAEGIVIRVAQANMWSLQQHLQARGFARASHSDFQSMRLANAWPLFGIDFDEKNLPQEVGRDAQTLSFTKGCYLGQETVARLDALGQVQKKLVRLCMESQEPPLAGTKLTCNDSDAGWITSAAANDGHCLAFGFVKRAYLSGVQNMKIGNVDVTFSGTE